MHALPCAYVNRTLLCCANRHISTCVSGRLDNERAACLYSVDRGQEQATAQEARCRRQRPSESPRILFSCVVLPLLSFAFALALALVPLPAVVPLAFVFAFALTSPLLSPCFCCCCWSYSSLSPCSCSCSYSSSCSALALAVAVAAASPLALSGTFS